MSTTSHIPKSSVILWKAFPVVWRSLAKGVQKAHLGVTGQVFTSFCQYSARSWLLVILCPCMFTVHHIFRRHELQSSPHSTVCDVIGVVVFAGRQERIRSKGETALQKCITQLQFVFRSTAYCDSGEFPFRCPEVHLLFVLRWMEVRV